MPFGLLHNYVISTSHCTSWSSLKCGSAVQVTEWSTECSLFRSQPSIYCLNLRRKFKLTIEMLILHDNLEFSIDKGSLINWEDDGEINILPAVVPFMRPNLNRNQGNCIMELRVWMARNRLMLYEDKTDFLLKGTRQQLLKFNFTCITAGSEVIECKSSVRKNWFLVWFTA